MSAAGLGKYFEKTIGKPLIYSVVTYGNYSHQVFEDVHIIEPMMVEDDVLSALVILKGVKDRHHGLDRPERHYGQTDIPIRDGDTFDTIMKMAIADARFGEESLDLRGNGDEDHPLTVAYRLLAQRRADEPRIRPPGM